MHRGRQRAQWLHSERLRGMGIPTLRLARLQNLELYLSNCMLPKRRFLGPERN